jgi:hypothetical protein
MRPTLSEQKVMMMPFQKSTDFLQCKERKIGWQISDYPLKQKKSESDVHRRNCVALFCCRDKR